MSEENKEGIARYIAGSLDEAEQRSWDRDPSEPDEINIAVHLDDDDRAVGTTTTVKNYERDGIPVKLTDWDNHMDKLTDVMQTPITERPVIDPTKGGQIGYIAPTYENGVANGFIGTEEEWRALVEEIRANAPKEGYVEQMVVETHTPESSGELLKEMTTPKEGEDSATIKIGQVESFASSTKEANLSAQLAKALHSLPQIFPTPDNSLPKTTAALIRFFMMAVSDVPFTAVALDPRAGSYPADLRIFRYAGMDGDQEVTWFRFQVGEQSRSFVVLTKLIPEFMVAMEGPEPMAWTHQRRHSAKGFNLNVTQAPIELPLSFFPFSFDKDPLDDLFDGDFTQVKEVCERLNEDLRIRLGEINRIALKLADIIGQKDHDLYLSFKGVNGLKEMNVALDRVYPKLPESGEIVLGDEPINIFEWSGYSKVVQVNVKRISHGTRQINRMFAKYRALVSQHPAIQELFDANLKEQLMASSHFLNRVYGFSAAYGVKYMEEVANDIIGKLNAHGGSIGLDLNEWVVYEYHETGRPTPIEDETLDFKKQILNSYTQSFVDALYGYLLDVPNPYIKPYTYREVVEGDDGIEVGTIRQV